MASFNISIPFKGEALSTFKLISDFYSYSFNNNEKCNLVEDEKVSFSLPLTFGVFRLLLDGNCEIIDRDFDSCVGLYKFSSKDRGGKGKLDSNIKLFMDHNSTGENLAVFEFNPQTKGLLSRVDLQIKKTLTEKFKPLIEELLATNSATIVEPQISHIDLIKLEKDETNLKTGRPLWVIVMQLPANMVISSFNFIKSLLNGALRVTQK
ncbi:MAG: hypothetical protein U0R17_01205 [Acidimicrobiia bacterium]